MKQLLLHNAQLVLADCVQAGAVLIRDGRIAWIFPPGQEPKGLSKSESLDIGQMYLAPGMIDIHIHGSAGVDVLETDANGLTSMSEFLLGAGVTGWFATLVPTDDAGYHSALNRINQVVRTQPYAPRRARILGIHFEGPFVNRARCGALRPEYFRTYDGNPASLEIFTPKSESGTAVLMTLAPEIPGGLDLIRDIVSRGSRAFIGHSQADLATLDLAALAGAKHITHFPNALDPLHHRKPGAVAWGLVRTDITLDCIADFHHVHPLMLRLIHQSKGARGMALISDAIMPAGLGDGEFSIWGETVAVRNGRTELARPGVRGLIAGSVITMRQALDNILGLGISLCDAFQMTSLLPATIAGVGAVFGSIEKGKRADLLVLDDNNELRLALVGGETAFEGS